MLMRHSHASSDNPAFSDHERPLTLNGRTLASETARLLITIGTPDRILCSSAVRTRETADILAAELTPNKQPEAFESLYLAPPHEYPKVCAEHLSDEETVLIIGHNPGIASLIATWANEHLSVSPATVAVFQVGVSDWQALTSGSEIQPKLSALITQGNRAR